MTSAMMRQIVRVPPYFGRLLTSAAPAFVQVTDAAQCQLKRGGLLACACAGCDTAHWSRRALVHERLNG